LFRASGRSKPRVLTEATRTDGRSTITYAFIDEIGIREVDLVEYDDGQVDENALEINDARGILEWFTKRRPADLSRYS
jgi:hypothetical protein